MSLRKISLKSEQPLSLAQIWLFICVFAILGIVVCLQSRAATDAVDSWSGDTLGSTSVASEPAATPDPASQVPGVPTGLTAAGGKGKVTLHWDASPPAEGVAKYNVYRTDQAAAVPWATPHSTTFVNTAKVFGGLKYCYQISATNAAGTGEKTAPVCAAAQ